MYDLDKASSLKINDVIEAAGFLSFNPDGVTSVDGEAYLPPSLVPRLHAIAWKNVNSQSPVQSELFGLKLQIHNKNLISTDWLLKIVCTRIGFSCIVNLVKKSFMPERLINLNLFDHSEL